MGKMISWPRCAHEVSGTRPSADDGVLILFQSGRVVVLLDERRCGCDVRLADAVMVKRRVNLTEADEHESFCARAGAGSAELAAAEGKKWEECSRLEHLAESEMVCAFCSVLASGRVA